MTKFSRRSLRIDKFQSVISISLHLARDYI